MSDIAINVDKVSKLYKLYDKPSDRLKETLGFTKEKKYREHFALSDVSFNVKKGQTVGIIGTNGSGKSTVLKIITGVLNPTSGKVDISGRISALLELGAGFNMEYTGIENIYLNGTMMGYSKEEVDEKLQTILDFADIGDFVKQPVVCLSDLRLLWQLTLILRFLSLMKHCRWEMYSFRQNAIISLPNLKMREKPYCL